MVQIKLYLTIILAISVRIISAQNSVEDFKKVRSFYANNNSLYMEVVLVNFETAKDTKGEIVAKGKMCKSGNNYYSKLENDVMICNGKQTLIADHFKKTIMLFESSKPEIMMTSQKNMDELLTFKDSVIFKGMANGIKKYIIFTPGNDIVKTEIHINTNNYSLKKLAYYYAPETNEITYESYKLEVEYTLISTENIDKKWFNIAGYVKQNRNGKYEPALAYSNYKLNVIKE